MKISPEMYPWTTKNQLNFGSRPPLDPDPGILWRILWHCETALFSTIWLISLEILVEYSRKFYRRCISLDKEILVSFWTWSAFRIRLGGDLRRSALSEWSCQYLLTLLDVHRHISVIWIACRPSDCCATASLVSKTFPFNTCLIASD